jgi:hypothetical protein
MAKNSKIFDREKSSNKNFQEKKSRYSKRRWSIESKKHQSIIKLLRHGVGICTIAEIVGVGVRTVQRRKEFLDAELTQSVAKDDGQAVAFSTGRHVCEVHGAVSVWPCVACAAIASRGIPSGADAK